MTATTPRRLVLAVLIAALSAVTMLADSDKSSLLFTPVSTAQTTGVVTTQLDNLRLEATVKWNGPSNPGSLIVYNGHGAVTGWGILLFGSTDNPPNAIAVLAGGVTIVSSPLTLTQGQWQHIQMDRVGQDVTVTLQDVVGDNDHDNGHGAVQTFDFGIIPANPVGGRFSNIEGTDVGNNFNGFIRDASVSTLGLSSPTVVESWNFTEGSPFGGLTLYGPTAAGVNGHVLHLQNVSWAVGNNHNN